MLITALRNRCGIREIREAMLARERSIRMQNPEFNPANKHSHEEAQNHEPPTNPQRTPNEPPFQTLDNQGIAIQYGETRNKKQETRKRNTHTHTRAEVCVNGTLFEKVRNAYKGIQKISVTNKAQESRTVGSFLSFFTAIAGKKGVNELRNKVRSVRSRFAQILYRAPIQEMQTLPKVFNS